MNRSQSESPVRCLLIANIFPPINGGSAIVYESMARFSPPGSMRVLAPWKHYVDGVELPGWREFDRSVPYPIHRVELLRPPMMASDPRHRLESLWRVAAIDMPIYTHVLCTVRRLIRQEGVNIICIGELVSNSWIGLACRRLFGVPFINYIHGEEITAEMPFRRFGQRRAEYLAKSDGVIGVSDFTVRELETRMSVPKEKICLIHNGVDVGRYRPVAPVVDVRTKHGLEGKRIILSVGRQVARKGFDRVIEALPTILGSCPDAHYLVVGQGDYRSKLEALVADLGLAAHVTFAGPVPSAELASYYQSCDMFAMPNRTMPDGDTEGFGLVFLEANACGKAVVAGRAGGAVEAVIDGDNGILVDGESTDAIAEAILRILMDDVLRTRLEEGGVRRAASSSWAVRAERFQSFCNEVLGSSTRLGSCRTVPS